MGVTISDLSRTLSLLKTPSELTLSLLQALKVMKKRSMIDSAKAFPSTFFNFSGPSTRLVTFFPSFPFLREYHFFTWFRIENPTPLDPETQSILTPEIFSMLNPQGRGVTVSISGNQLRVRLCLNNNSKDDYDKPIFDHHFAPGVWYFISVKHYKPTLMNSLFGNDEFTLSVDDHLILKRSVKFPSPSLMENTEISFGKNFDGQMGPIYLMNECLPNNVLDVISTIDANKSNEELARASNGLAPDTLIQITTPDRKVHPINSKVLLSYYPERCTGGFAVDVHGGKHGRLTQIQHWRLTSPRDVLQSIGGIKILLPLFPRLLVENDQQRLNVASQIQSQNILESQLLSLNLEESSNYSQVDSLSTQNIGFGTALSEIDDEELSLILDADLLLSLREARNGLGTGEGCIGLLLSILSNCLIHSKQNKRDFIASGGVDLIEYALTCVPSDVIRAESESCALAIMQLRSAVRGHHQLDCKLTQLLLCNFEVWSRGSYQLQHSLMSILLAEIQAQPDYFLTLVGIPGFLHCIQFYMDNQPNESEDHPQELEHHHEGPEEPSSPLPRSSALVHRRSSVTSKFQDSLKVLLHQDVAHRIEESSISPSLPTDSTTLETQITLLSPLPSTLSTARKLVLSESASEEQLNLEDDHASQTASSQVSHSSSRAQRKRLREFLTSMIFSLIIRGGSEREVVPLIDFVACCKDKVVLFEMVQLLLCLLVEGDSKMMCAVTLALNGPEEFTSFVLLNLVHQPQEDVRCVGIRLLTHYYSRIDFLPNNLQTLSLKRKASLLSRFESKSSGLKRLQEIGGLSLLSDIVLSHLKTSSEITYSALFELLISKPGLKNAFVQLNDFLDAQSNMKRLPPSYPVSSSRVGQRSVSFPTAFMNPDSNDEDIGSINQTFLPVFLDLLPHFSVSCHEQIYNDLLALLKQGRANRDALCNCSHWHASLFSMVSQVVFISTDSEVQSISTQAVVSELDKWASFDQEFISSITSQTSLLPTSPLTTFSLHSPPTRGRFDSAGSELEGHRGPLILNEDIQFSIGMKVYATLLVSALENENGWKELELSLSQSFREDLGSAVSQAVLSHMINDLTFSMKSKYKEILKLAKSANPSENDEALVRLENIFSVMILAAEYCLDGISCVALGIPEFNRIGWLRVKYTKEVLSEQGETFTHSDPNDDEEESLMDRKIKKAVEDRILHHLSTANSRASISGGDRRYSVTSMEEARSTISPMDTESEEFIGRARSESEANFSAFRARNSTLHQSSVLQCFDFSHIWSDLVPGDQLVPSTHAKSRLSTLTSTVPTSPSTPLNSPMKTSSVFPFSSPSASSKRSHPFSREKILHPLERGHHLGDAKLILILQILRFFDSIFWPKETGTHVRNARWLRFYKESSHEEGILGTQNRLSLFSTAIRLSLYTLQTLSPFTDLAVQNLNRIQALVLSLTDVSLSTTPKESWVLALLLHITVTLQRLSTSLQPVFDRIGLNSPMSVITVGITAESWQSEEESRILKEESVIRQLFRTGSPPSTLKESEIPNYLAQRFQMEDYFGSESARALLRFVRSLMCTVVVLTDEFSSLLSESLESQTYKILLQMIEKLKYDYQFIDPHHQPYHPHSPPETRQHSNNSHDIDISILENPKIKKKFESFSINTSSSNPVPLPEEKIFSMNTGRKSTQTQEDSEPPHLNLSSTMPFSEGGLEQVAVILSRLRDPYLKCDLLHSTELIRHTLELETHEFKSTQSFVDEILATQKKLENDREKAIKSRDESLLKEIMDLKGLSAVVVQNLKKRQQLREARIREREALRIKCVATHWSKIIQQCNNPWAPWFTEDPLILAAISSLPMPEEMPKTLRDAGPKERQLTVSTLNLTSNLGEEMPVYQSDPFLRKRRNSLSSVYIPKTEISGGGGVVQYEIARHRDSLMRGMVMVKKAECSDYSDKAYLDGKVRDQLNFENSKNSEHSVEGESKLPIPTSFLKAALIKHSKSDPTEANDPDLDPYADDESSVSPLQLSPAMSAAISTGLQGINNLFQQTQFDRPLWSQVYLWSPEEKIQLILESTTRIQLGQLIIGTLMLTNKYLYYHPKEVTGGLLAKDESEKSLLDSRWPLDRLIEMYGRRHLLQNCAIELKFIDHCDLFFALENAALLAKFFQILRSQHLPLLSTPPSLKPKVIVEKTQWTELWKNRQISNFEYLMRLNLIAGRSHNDITQYPVFPWVISDYTSDTLDLENRSIYRDLTKPIGALNPTRLMEFHDRCRSLGDDDEIPKFLFGSHYSGAGIVLHFMIRQEPFTNMSVSLQGGRFDCPDRTFFDISRCWQGCNNSMSDVKELIPELFCCPEALINTNNIPLGELQEGGVVDDVRLPPWAQKNPFEFIRLNRAALESEYVSQNLHHWIDLIFGYKQRGEAAFAADNLFYFLTYENAINIDAIEDKLQRDATRAQVTHYGQTPSQLFVKPHPERLPREECSSPICSESTSESISRIRLFTPSKQLSLATPATAQNATVAAKVAEYHGGIIVLRASGDRLVVVHSDLSVCSYVWKASPDAEGPVQIKLDRNVLRMRGQLPSVILSMSREILDRFAPAYTRIPAPTTMASQFSSPEKPRPVPEKPNTPPPSTATIPPISGFGLGIGMGGFARRIGLSSPNSGPTQSSPSPTPSPSMSPLPDRSSQRLRISQVGMMDFEEELQLEATEPVFNPREVLRVNNRLVAIFLEPSSLHSSLHFGGYGRIVTCGYWDHSIKVHSLDNNQSFKEIASVNSGHFGAITCLHLSSPQTEQTILTGGVDGTVRVWVLENPSVVMSFSYDNPLLTGDFLGIGISGVRSDSGTEGSSSGSVGSSGGPASSGKGPGAATLGSVNSSVGGGNTSNFVEGLGNAVASLTGNQQFGPFIDLSASGPDQNSNREGSSDSPPLPSSQSTSTPSNLNSPLVCVSVLLGHTSPITAIHHCPASDLVLSGSSSGLLCLHTLRQGQERGGHFIRSLRHCLGHPIDQVLISPAGYLVAYSSSALRLWVFWVNGQLLARKIFTTKLESLALNGSSQVLVCGDSEGSLIFLRLWDLQEIYTRDELSIHGAILSLSFTEDQQHLLVGSADGTFSVCIDPEGRYRPLQTAILKSF